MRLLPGYAMAPSQATAVLVLRRFTPATTAAVVDAVAVEVLPTRTIQARAAADLMRARTAIHWYSSVYRINKPSSGSLNVFA